MKFFYKKDYLMLKKDYEILYESYKNLVSNNNEKINEVNVLTNSLNELSEDLYKHKEQLKHYEIVTSDLVAKNYELKTNEKELKKEISGSKGGFTRRINKLENQIKQIKLEYSTQLEELNDDYIKILEEKNMEIANLEKKIAGELKNDTND